MQHIKTDEHACDAACRLCDAQNQNRVPLLTYSSLPPRKNNLMFALFCYAVKNKGYGYIRNGLTTACYK